MLKKIVIFFLFMQSILFSSEIDVKNGLYRITYDRVLLPKNEIMGLAGINYLYKTKYDFYYGFGGYGALEGERGGFFTGGLELGKKFSLSNTFSVDLGMFVGGGGGGAAPQGGGLMLRPHAGVLYDMKLLTLGLSLSRVDFPNGDISSDQISLQLETPFKTIYSSNNKSITLNDILPLTSPYGKISWRNNYFSMVLQNYYTPDNMKNTEGEDHIGTMNLIGVEYGGFINENLFAILSSSGAYGGKTDGYMEVFTGLGYKYPLTSYFGITSKVLIGGAGGGRIDSAGGASYKANLSTYLSITPNTQLDIGTGRIESFIGTYEATTLNANLTYNMNILSFGDSKDSISSLDYELGKWSVRLTNQTYLADEELRYHRVNLGNINLVGFKLNRYFSDNIYITGQAYAAYNGGSGGYAAGLFGLGYISDRYFNSISLLFESEFGAAGGGSVDVGGGTIVQFMSGIDYKITDSISFQAHVGKIKALYGSLDTPVIDIGFVYKIYKIEKVFK